MTSPLQSPKPSHPTSPSPSDRSSSPSIPSSHHTPSIVSPTTRIKNRRKTYLLRHPSYFGPSLEPADPLLYDRCIRAFQTPAERTAEATDKGFAGVLAADILRGEARLASMAEQKAVNSEEEAEDEPENREEGWERWTEAMEWRFLRGEDEDFDYGEVDKGEEWDDWEGEEREREERWFDGEEEAWDVDERGERRGEGETGVQDF